MDERLGRGTLVDGCQAGGEFADAADIDLETLDIPRRQADRAEDGALPATK